MVTHENIGLRGGNRQEGAVDRVVDDLDPERWRQPRFAACGRGGGDPAEKQRLHLTVWAARKPSRTVIPSPGRSGISISPSSTWNASSTRSWSSGLAPSEYSTMNPAGDA